MDKIQIPPIKSQGIKTKLVPFIASLLPENQDFSWFEPFMGTGVVGFNLAHQNAVMTDSNPYIISFYNAIQSGEINPQTVEKYLLQEGEKLYKSEGSYYYEVRKRFNDEGNPLDFLFLNRSCFNGIMRFNKKGGFNVPFCRKPERFSRSYITKISNQVLHVSERLSSCNFQFSVSSFTETINRAGRGDLIYCDPPYIGRSSDYFNSWSEEDEMALFQALKESHASFILSTWSHNAYRENSFLRDLWGSYPHITKEHYYHVGGSENNRHGMVEALVFSHDLRPRDIKNISDSQNTLF